MTPSVRLTRFEDKVAEALLAGDDPVLQALREQFSAARVKSRNYTGLGFQTTFELSGDTPSVEPQDLFLGDVTIEMSGTNAGADGIIVVRDGKIAYLECFVCAGRWPTRPRVKAISYRHRNAHSDKRRDLDALRRSWSC